MNNLITIKPRDGRSLYLFTVKNTTDGRSFIRGYRELRRVQGESNIVLRGRNPNRKQFIGVPVKSSCTGARYDADKLKRSIPQRFAKSFDVYVKS